MIHRANRLLPSSPPHPLHPCYRFPTTIHPSSPNPIQGHLSPLIRFLSSLAIQPAHGQTFIPRRCHSTILRSLRACLPWREGYFPEIDSRVNRTRTGGASGVTGYMAFCVDDFCVYECRADAVGVEEGGVESA